jgi:hypothetical protein
VITTPEWRSLGSTYRIVNVHRREGEQARWNMLISHSRTPLMCMFVACGVDTIILSDMIKDGQQSTDLKL